jgi:hypothetical protein
MQVSPSPLTDVAMSFVRLCALSPLDDSAQQELRDSFAQFLDSQILRDPVASLLQSHVGTVEPLERIENILRVSDTPLPVVRLDYDGAPGRDRKKPWPWTPVEDARLLSGIHRFGLENWGHVAQFVGNNRSRAQCSQRWLRGLDPRISKEHWTADDEGRLLALVREKGTRVWTQIANAIGTRSDVQCRYHFFQMARDGKLPPDLASAATAGRPPAIPTAPPPLRTRPQPVGNAMPPPRRRASLPSIDPPEQTAEKAPASDGETQSKDTAPPEFAWAIDPPEGDGAFCGIAGWW